MSGTRTKPDRMGLTQAHLWPRAGEGSVRRSLLGDRWLRRAVSTIGQTPEQQTEALTAAVAGKTFHDVMSDARDDRPSFAEWFICGRAARQY